MTVRLRQSQVSQAAGFSTDGYFGAIVTLVRAVVVLQLRVHLLQALKAAWNNTCNNTV